MDGGLIRRAIGHIENVLLQSRLLINIPHSPPRKELQIKGNNCQDEHWRNATEDRRFCLLIVELIPDALINSGSRELNVSFTLARKCLAMLIAFDSGCYASNCRVRASKALQQHVKRFEIVVKYG